MYKRQAQGAGLDAQIFDYLKGPSAFAFGYEDAVAPAKILKDAIKKYKKCEIKGGVINGVVSDAEAMNTLAEMCIRDRSDTAPAHPPYGRSPAG